MQLKYFSSLLKHIIFYDSYIRYLIPNYYIIKNELFKKNE